MKSESEVGQLILIEAAKFGIKLWRNNSGALKDKDGRVVRYGLGNDSQQINSLIKSSDYIGITPITITPAMVGQTVGIFTAIEAKAPGAKTDPKRFAAQKAFIDFVKSKGGLAGFADSIESFWSIFPGRS